MEELSKENVLVCFYLHEVYLDNGSELPPMSYTAALDTNIIEASNSILSDTGSQLWINQNKAIWNMPRSSFDECIDNDIGLTVDVKWYSENDDSNDIACSFAITLPFVEDKVNWNSLYEVTANDYHCVYHLHAQTCYSIDEEYQQSISNNVIHLSSIDSVDDTSAADYELNMSVESIENWSELEELLIANHLSSNSYTLYTSFYQYYQTDPQTTFNLNPPLIPLEPLQFHCPIHLLSSYLRYLEPPVIQLLNQENEVLCEFFPDFEKYSISLSCCPSDQSIEEGESVVRLNDTIELHDILDTVQDCPVVIQGFTNTQITLRFAMSLRKVTFSQESIPNPEEIVQTNQPCLNESVQESDSIPHETVQESIPIPNETIQKSIPIPNETIQKSIPIPNETVQKSTPIPIPTETVQESTPISNETVQKMDSNSNEIVQVQESTPIPIPTESVQMIISNSNEAAQVQVLQLKLKNLEEFQAETVKHYEKELERKQNTITKLTQANREYEKVFIDSIKAPSNDTIQLRNENEQLKAEISKLREKIVDLQKQNDEMREIMVKTVTKESTDSEEN